ncbi:MAG: ATP-grasp domain-containing protein [Chloroflexota bacterium]
MKTYHDPLMNIRWILESQVLPDLHQKLQKAAEDRGHAVSIWNDDWPYRWPNFADQFVIFHGSLGVAHDIAQSSPWTPGAFCNLERFTCSNYYSLVASHLIHQSWQTTTVQKFVARPDDFFKDASELFVRPDSPLKPFSGRVISRENVSLRALDHGFYYDELDLPIILTPTRQVGQEWRFVVHDQQVITGSGYVADGRSGTVELTSGAAWEMAQAIAETLEPPDPLYVLDIAESDGRLWLMELNPFSGADLYACNVEIIVNTIEHVTSE